MNWSLEFVVRPRAGLATGTQLRNVALITFDQNERIATNQVSETDASLGTDPAKEALVTIDAVRPNSVVQNITSPEPSPTFDVAWSGTDDAGGSGVASFDILVSTDGCPFLPWQAAVTATSATFYGEIGRTTGKTRSEGSVTTSASTRPRCWTNSMAGRFN